MRWLHALAMILLACACTEPAGPSGLSGTSRSAKMEIPLSSSRALDILIVVDDSPAMAPHQDELRAAATGLTSVLSSFAGGMPDLHLGVISTDVGTVGATSTAPGPAIGAIGQGGCAGTGKRGDLQTNGAAITGAFLTDVRVGDGTRAANYTGDLAAVVDQMMRPGTGGCAYARPIEAVTRALADDPANAGFLRPEAPLAVIVIAAADDCSFADPSFLAGATTTDTSRCQTDGAGLVGLDGLIVQLKTLKTDPTKVMLLGVFGTAAPPRLHALLGAFPNRSSEATLDAADPAAGFAFLAWPLYTDLGIACWSVPLADLDPIAPGLQAECTGELTNHLVDLALKRCAPGLESPCFAIGEDPVNCFESGLVTRFEHLEDYPGPGLVSLECLVDSAP